MAEKPGPESTSGVANEPPAPDTASLEARIRELEAENARLAAAPAAPDDAAGDAAATTGKGRAGWWRGLLSAVCIVVAALLVPVSVVGAWARAELVDEDQFVATLAPLASNASVQDLVIDQAMTAIDQKVDFAQITGQVIDGVAGLNGMPPRIADLLALLKQPAADGLHNLVEDAVTKVVQSSAFADVWTSAVRDAHRALTTVATSDGGGIVTMTPKGLGLELGPIIDQVKQRLVDQGVGVANMIPSIDKTIIIGDGSAVTTVRTVYGIATAAGWWLPLVSLALFLLGILLARRRSTAVVGSGIGLALGAGALAVTLSVGHTIVGVAASELKLSGSALDHIYSSLVDQMSQTAIVAAVLGVFVIVTGWALGGWSSSRRMRSVIGGLNRSARTALAGRGLDTGRFGVLLFRYRSVVHVAMVVLAIVWLLLLRPLSFGDIVLVVVVVLLVAWVLELLQKRPGETPAHVVIDDPEEDEDAAAQGDDPTPAEVESSH